MESSWLESFSKPSPNSDALAVPMGKTIAGCHFDPQPFESAKHRGVDLNQKPPSLAGVRWHLRCDVSSIQRQLTVQPYGGGLSRLKGRPEHLDDDPACARNSVASAVLVCALAAAQPEMLAISGQSSGTCLVNRAARCTSRFLRSSSCRGPRIRSSLHAEEALPVVGKSPGHWMKL